MKRTLPVIGMACASCSAHVERTLNGLSGVQSASVSLASRTALIDYDPSAITLEEMKAAINGIGFDLVIEADRSVEAIERRAYVRLRRRTLLSWLFALLTMAISMGWISLGSTAFANQAALLLALANLVFCGRRFYVSAWRQLLHKTPTWTPSWPSPPPLPSFSPPSTPFGANKFGACAEWIRPPISTPR